MEKIRINKLGAAARQIDASVRMTFSNEDPAAIHTIAAAAFRIVHDICKQNKKVESYLRFTDWIADGHEREFWAQFNSPANFLKHADRDAADIQEIVCEQSDFMIVAASKWYADLGNPRSHEMTIFGIWWSLQNPKTLKPEFMEHFAKQGIQVTLLSEALEDMSRSERLRWGAALLERQKSSP